MGTRQASSIAVLGAGSWGTALAILLARNGHNTLLWGRDPYTMTELSRARRNARFLPGTAFPEPLQPTHSLQKALKLSEDCLLAVPSHAFRAMLERIAPLLKPDARVAWAIKGLEHDSGKLPHQIAAELLGNARPLATVSGPTFASEVANECPTAVTVASRFPEFAAQLAACLHNDSFRVYTSDDVIGVEVGGALKNVLAIAAGAIDGLNLGANTRAALITRGLAEMMRLGEALGGRRETFMGLTGLGDLVLTCTDDLSRNRRLGLALARGETLEAALKNIGQVVEGVQTAREVVNLAAKLGIEMPITEQVYQVLYAQRAPREALQVLFNRVQRAETV